MELVAIKDIREGDKFVDRVSEETHWTAESDAELLATGDFRIRVRHVDGGLEDRRWTPTSADLCIPIVRAE